MPPPESCMKKAQQSLIRSALSDAFDEGLTFTTSNGVIAYLTEAGVSEKLLLAHVDEIFTCFLTLLNERNKGGALSPPPSEGSPIRASDNSVEGDDCADAKRIAPPVFPSEEIVYISLFRSRLRNFGVVVGKICEGNVSYISETAVRKNHLDRDKPSIVLQWHYPSEDTIFHTRCIVVKPELIPNCDIALGEDCGKEDEEEPEEEQQQHDGDSSEDSMNISNDAIPNNMVTYEPLGAMSPQRLSPQEESLFVRVSAAMNAETTLHLLRLTSPALPPQAQSLPLTLDRLREQDQSRLPRRSAGSRKMS